MKSKKLYIYSIVSILSFLLTAYSYLGMIMIGSFRATPSYPPERGDYNMRIYVSMFFISILSGIVFAVLALVNLLRKQQ